MKNLILFLLLFAFNFSFSQSVAVSKSGAPSGYSFYHRLLYNQNTAGEVFLKLIADTDTGYLHFRNDTLNVFAATLLHNGSPISGSSDLGNFHFSNDSIYHSSGSILNVSDLTGVLRTLKLHNGNNLIDFQSGIGTSDHIYLSTNSTNTDAAKINLYGGSSSFISIEAVDYGVNSQRLEVSPTNIIAPTYSIGEIDNASAYSILTKEWALNAIDSLSGSGSGTIDDGTATGQMTYWNGSKWTYAATSNLFWDYSNGQLSLGGSGSSSPDSPLYVVGSNDGANVSSDPIAAFIQEGVTYEVPSSIYSQIHKGIYVLGGTAAYFIGRAADVSTEFGMGISGASGNPIFIGSLTANDLQLRTNNTTQIHIESTNGYVGIGTTTPSSELDLDGDAEIDGTLDVTDRATFEDNISQSSQTVTGATTISLTNVYCTSSATANFDLTLPTYSSTTGNIYYVQNYSGYTVTLKPATGEVINGTTNATIDILDGETLRIHNSGISGIAWSTTAPYAR